MYLNFLGDGFLGDVWRGKSKLLLVKMIVELFRNGYFVEEQIIGIMNRSGDFFAKSQVAKMFKDQL